VRTFTSIIDAVSQLDSGVFVSQKIGFIIYLGVRFPWLRLYCPEKAVVDKAWKLPDIEQVN
jgi:hypothetical protein